MFDETGFDKDKWDERVDLNISLGDVLLIHGQITLALRHPNNTHASSERAREIVNRLELLLYERGMFDERFLRMIRADERDARAELRATK